MKATLRQVGVLLEQFQKSEWRELYMRTGSLSLFLAKNGGAPNPLLAAGMTDSTATPGATAVVAPHLGTVASTLQPGTDVLAGEIVAQIELLGELIEIACEQSGIVEAVLAPVGSLIEYDAPLLSIRQRERA